MKIIPMYRLDAVVNSWNTFIEGVNAILAHAGDDVSMEKIYNEIMARELLLWVAYDEKGYCGFCTTRIDKCPTTASFVSIIHCFIKPNTNPEVFLEGLKQLERHAKEFNCQGLRFWTRRDKGFERKLKNLGWKQSYVEFYKEVE